MPTYVYACDSCGAQFEQFQRFSDEPLKVCPCGKEGQVRRVFQPVGIVFKGSGWYVTDSRGASAKGGEPAASESKPAGEGDKVDKADKADKPEAAPAKPEAAPAKPASAEPARNTAS
jgi:putative FmdB family regulatory protein